MCVEQIETVRALHDLLEGRQREVQTHQTLGFRFVVAEVAEKDFDVRMLEVVLRLLDFVLVVDVAVGQHLAVGFGPYEVIDVLDALQVHGQTFKAVGDFAEHRLAGQRADFLEVGELGDFHAVEPDFPAEAPGAERRRFPIVLDEANVVLFQVDAQRFERLQVKLLNVVGRGLQDYLILVVVLQAVRIFTIAAVLRSARRLHEGGVPRLRADGAEERCGMESAGTDLDIVRLEQRTTLFVPKTLETQDDFLKRRLNGHVRLRQNGRNRDFTWFFSRRERRIGRKGCLAPGSHGLIDQPNYSDSVIQLWKVSPAGIVSARSATSPRSTHR